MGLEKCPKCGKESLIKTPRSIINLKVVFNCIEQRILENET